MKILFTKSELLGSKLIRGITGESVSHCAIEQEGLVLHASYWGVAEVTYEDFASSHQIIYEVGVPGDRDKFFDLMETYLGKSYDYGALFFLAIKYLAKRMGIKTPKINLWQSSGAFICSELVSAAILNKQDSLITPYQLYLELLKENTKGELK